MRNLSWTGSWQGIVLLDKMLIPNYFTVGIEFLSTGDDGMEQVIAFDRMQCIIEDIMSGAVFANVDNPLIAKLHKNFSAYIVTLPAEPIDYVICATLFSKLLSVVEGRLIIDSVSVSSKMGSDIINIIHEDELAAMDWMVKNKIKEATGNEAWWHRTDSGCTDILLAGKDTNTVIHDIRDWKELELDWASAKSQVDSKEPKVVKFPDKWSPKIIDGGKNDKG